MTGVLGVICFVKEDKTRKGMRMHMSYISTWLGGRKGALEINKTNKNKYESIENETVEKT